MDRLISIHIPKTGIKISVVIPIYNVEMYLSECLNSVLDQTLRDIEIICVNDASTDKSIEILKGHANRDSRIIIINHKQNYGLAVTRNTAIKVAKGEYIFFLDSDDLLFKTSSLSQMYNIAKQDNADEVIGGTLRWDEETGDRDYGYHKNYIQKSLNGIRFETALFLIHNVIACNKLLKTSFLKQHALEFNPESRKFEDCSFSWKIHLLAKSISVYSSTTYIHRLRDSTEPQSLMTQTKRDSLYYMIAARDIMAFLEKNCNFDSIRHVIDEKLVLRFIRDALKTINANRDIRALLEEYQQIFSRIPKESIKKLPPGQIALLELMHRKQYEDVCKKLKITSPFRILKNFLKNRKR